MNTYKFFKETKKFSVKLFQSGNRKQQFFVQVEKSKVLSYVLFLTGTFIESY